MTRVAQEPTIALLLRLVDQGYERKAWHGPNLRGALRGLDPEAAAWRPAPGRHNIWEIAVHAAYWKYAVRRRLLGEKRGAFPAKGSNWFRRPDAETEAAWRADLALLDAMHRRMREAIAALSPHDLARPTPGASRNVADLITGIAAHDVYHAGQIQLLKRLRASAEA
ncbi:MAG: DinB family protein [Candidatus Methylomirabilales bacterium]